MEKHEYLSRFREETPEWLLSYQPSDSITFKDLVSSRVAYYPGFWRDGSMPRISSAGSSMENYYKVKAQIAQNNLKQLELIEPFPVIVETLAEAIDCFYHTRQNSNFLPTIVFYGKDTDKDNEFEFLPSSLPRIFLQLVDANPPRFTMRIDFPKTDADCVKKKHMEAFLTSVFYSYIMPCDDETTHGIMVSLEVNVSTLARLITYFLQLLGFPDSLGLQMNKSMYISSGDMSLANFPEDLNVPVSFIKALAKLQEIYEGAIYDEGSGSLYLRLSALNAETDDQSMAIQMWKEDDIWLFSEQQTVGDRETLE